MCRGALFLMLALSAGCATARLAQAPSAFPADSGQARTVVIEPLFEVAAWKTTTRTDYAQVSTAVPGSVGASAWGATTVPVTTLVSEKPFFARPEVLADLQSRLVGEVQRRRPSWRVTSTGGAGLLTGDVAVVRTIIEGNEVTVSNRTLRRLCFGVGLVVWPVMFCAARPVEETELVTGALERYQLDASALSPRLVKYATQPDYAVNLAQVPGQRRPFGLEVTYDEGLLANEAPRRDVLVAGLVDRLATAIIAIIEEPWAPDAP